MIDVDFISGYKSHTKYIHLGKNTPTKCHLCSVMIEDGTIFVTYELYPKLSFQERDDYDNTSTYESYKKYSCRKCYNEYRLKVIKQLNNVMSSKVK